MPQEMKRYDGNPSGHISMDARALLFAKDVINKELTFQAKLRETGADQIGKYVYVDVRRTSFPAHGANVGFGIPHVECQRAVQAVKLSHTTNRLPRPHHSFSPSLLPFCVCVWGGGFSALAHRRSKPSVPVFPTPRPEWAPLTDRSVPLFRDSDKYFKKIALHDPKCGGEQQQQQPSDYDGDASSPSARSPTSRLASSGARALLDPSGAHASLASLRARALDRAEHEALSRRKAALEAQLRELDRVIAFKDKKKKASAAQPRADRPFANFVDTYRALPEACSVTPTIAGGWLREKNS